MLLWAMVIAQMLAWGWFSLKAGNLSHKKFFVFTLGMLIGQLGAGIDAYHQVAWKAFVVQVYFFIFTTVGGIRRFRQMRRSNSS